MTTGGGGGNGAQDPNSHAGKVLRLRDDGTVPGDNPFAGKADHRPEVYSLGHRNSIGLAIHPGTGDVWQNENGPNGGDEINVIRPGRNYGWPIVSFGRTYPGPWQADKFWREGFESPVVFWVPSIAISGMAFYTGDRLSRWKGDVFVGGMRTGEIPAPAISSAFCSTRRWRSCAANRCSPICGSGSVTCGRGRISCCMC